MDALHRNFEDIWRLIGHGGWVMAAIFLAGQMGWFLVMDRLWHFRAMRSRRHGLLARVEEGIASARPLGREAMVKRTREVMHAHVPGLSRHLGTLAVIAGAAPLLGLAGTVDGIMETFKVITVYGVGNPSMMAGGIAQALMVTEAGLVVAFPLLICHDLLQKRADALEDDCIAGATRLIREYAGERTQP